MSGIFSSVILNAHGAAREALARAEERLALFPEPAILIAHIRSAEQEALGWLEGESFIPEQLAMNYGYGPRAWRRWPFAFVKAFERKPPWSAIPTTDAVRTWLKADGPVIEGWPSPAPLEIADTRLEVWARQAARLSALPRLIASADLAASFARAAPLPHSSVVIGAMLADRCALAKGKLSAGGIAAIGLNHNRSPWRALLTGATDDDLDELTTHARDERCRLAWLEALGAGGTAVVRLDQRLRLWLARLDTACASRRKSSHLRPLALLAGAGPSLTVARAAKALGLSRQATTRLIAEACKAHLLREITQGNAFRRYVIAV